MSGASTRRGSILVVDDDRDTALYLSVLLEDKGYEVRTAEDEGEALSQLDEFPADTVIMDVLMPGRSGLDLLVKLRNSSRWRDLMVIVVTGNDRVLEDYGQSYLSRHKGIRGPDAVLGKPVDPVALLRLLDSRTSMQ
jgi:CheY-like chemotaxis protein